MRSFVALTWFSTSLRDYFFPLGTCVCVCGFVLSVILEVILGVCSLFFLLVTGYVVTE